MFARKFTAWYLALSHKKRASLQEMISQVSRGDELWEGVGDVVVDTVLPGVEEYSVISLQAYGLVWQMLSLISAQQQVFIQKPQASWGFEGFNHLFASEELRPPSVETGQLSG